MKQEESKIEDLIKKFNESETVKALDRYFSEKSMMEVLGVDRDENAHSNFLAWLFENEVTGKEACCRLIRLLDNKSIENINIEKIKTIRENYVDGKVIGSKHSGRADIVLELSIKEQDAINKQYIIIENKVLSDIHQLGSKKNGINEKEPDEISQLKAYHKYYNSVYGENVLYTLLSIPENDVSGFGFTNITYQKIYESILCPLIDSCHECSILIRINEYIRALAISYTQTEVMAVDIYLENLVYRFWTENKELFEYFRDKNLTLHKETLQKFWNTMISETGANRDIIRLSFKLLNFHLPKALKEEANGIKEIYTVINSRRKDGKDNTKYKIGNSSLKDKPKLVDELVRRYISNYEGSDLSIEMLNSVFPYSLGLTRHEIVKEFKSKKYAKRIKYSVLLSEDKIPIRLHEKSSKMVCVYHTRWDRPELMSRLIKYVKTLDEFKDVVILEIPLFLQKTDDNTKS